MEDEAREEEDIMLDAGEGEGPTTVEEGAGDGAAYSIWGTTAEDGWSGAGERRKSVEVVLKHEGGLMVRKVDKDGQKYHEREPC